MRKECLKSIFNLAKKDKKVLFIGSDLGPGVLSEFKKKFSNRYFMEGVSEQAIIGIAAGLAMEGYKPYINTIATFLTRRCFEQVCIDLCLHNLPVKLIANGGGLVYAPLGPTHLATEDISIMRTLPNMKIIAPCDAYEMKVLMKKINNLGGPVYVRIAKGGDKIITNNYDKISFGKAILKETPGEYLFITTGVMAQVALEAIKILKNKKIKVGLIHFGTVKPLDKDILNKWIPKVRKVVTVEENSLVGGFGSSILEHISDYMPKHTSKIKRIGIKDSFSKKYGTQSELFKNFNLTPKNLIDTLLDK
jgi:transketolase